MARIACFALLAVCASGVELSRSKSDELRDRVQACTDGIPGRTRGPFHRTDVDYCVSAAISFVTRPDNSEPSKVIESLPQCLRSAAVQDSDIAPVSQCLKTKIPLPWTYIEGNNDYSTLQAVWHQFAIQDCVTFDSEDNRCTKLTYSNFARGAAIGDVAASLAKCLETIASKVTDKNRASTVVQCFTKEAHDPQVEARARKYLADQGLKF